MAAFSIPAGRPPIDFLVHETRCLPGGAPYDFENMIAALVEAHYGDAHLAYTYQGDWGIDVLRGDLNGTVTIWQAKYYPREVDPRRVDAMLASLQSALDNAIRHHFRIDRWVVCFPSSMTNNAYQKWLREVVPLASGAGVVVELWDATRLLHLLHDDRAAHVREAYYNPYRPAPDRYDEPRLRLRAADPDPANWRGGLRLNWGGSAYLLHDPVTERVAPDRSWQLRTADAMALDGAAGPVRLTELRTQSPTPLRAGLLAQADLLSTLGGRDGLPTLLGRVDRHGQLVVISSRSDGPSWNDTYGTGGDPLDELVTPSMLQALASVAAALAKLHEHGQAHRDVHGGSITLTERGRRATLRDIGLAGLDRLPDEGGDQRAPEQRAMARGEVGPHTDVYQVAALAYRTATGFPPTSSSPPPVRATLTAFPASCDALLTRALDPDPARRPSMPALAAGLRSGARQCYREVAG